MAGDFFDLLANCQDGWGDVPDEPLEPGMAYLADLGVGEKFSVGDEVFILLEKCDDGGAIVVRKDMLPEASRFGESADWKSSFIRRDLNGRYYQRLAAIVGDNNIIPMTRDLTSLDGLDDYGSCIDNVSLMTVHEYAKYHRILGFASYPRWQYLITPFSTPSNEYTRNVCCVNYFGAVDWCGCDNDFGVRPFLKFNSSILVSVEDDG